MEGFAEVFGELEDPRAGNARRHLPLGILPIALRAVLSGGEDRTGMALFGRAKGPFLRLPSGVPSHDTFSRVFRLPDPARFHACFLRSTRRFAEATRGVVAVDGEALRRSFDRAADASPLHLVSARAVEQRPVLGQPAVDGESNGTAAVPELLASLSLEGTIVTADAPDCRRHTAGTVLARGGDHVLALEGNQGAPHAEVGLFLDDPRRSRAASHTTIDGGRGRVGTRASLVSSDIARLRESHRWPGPAAIGKVVRTREVAHYLPSTPLRAERLAEVARAHWGIENGLHWVLDVTMNEDRARNRKDRGPENLALLRRLALNLAKLEPSKGSMKGKLKRAAWDNLFLTQLLAQFAQPQMR
jgi:predicted transposase YbfD/YdcC